MEINSSSSSSESEGDNKWNIKYSEEKKQYGRNI